MKVSPFVFSASLVSHFIHRPTSLFAPLSTMSLPNHFYEFTADDMDNNPVSMESFRGNVVVIVNVASQ
jgi:hypothetical protein